MSIVSLQYSVFLFVVFVLFYAMPYRFQWKVLLAASVFFYMMNGPIYIFIPLFIGLTAYSAAILIEKLTSPSLKRVIFILGLLSILGVLIFFKYINFLLQSFLDIAGWVQHKPVVLNSWINHLVVPIALSYITFQAMGYLIEVYWQRHPAEKSAGYFLTYLLFFPKLFAGPIERAHHFLPQLSMPKKIDEKLIAEGAKLIVWGLFKKIVIADRLNYATDLVFLGPQMYTGFPLLFACLLFPIQLYADFSGYTDIAIGTGNLLGFRLMKNFDFPFIARSTTELWRRWHISLSTWFYEYVYNPIAMAKRDWGQWAVVYASLITFIVLGLWHGANWKFVFFGFFEGMVLSWNS